MGNSGRLEQVEVYTHKVKYYLVERVPLTAHNKNMHKKLSIGRMAGTQTNYIDIDVTLKEGRLSISGDVRRETAGQCQDFIREAMEKNGIDYAIDWNREELKRLLDTWDVWHLNDMHPECEHQAVDGTLEQAQKDVTIYGYKLDMEIVGKQDKVKEKAMERLLSGSTVILKPHEAKLLKLEYSLKSLDSTAPEHYKEAKETYFGTKTEKAGWVSFEEYPNVGILSKPCATCGYKYGSAWKTVELPKEVVEYVESL